MTKDEYKVIHNPMNLIFKWEVWCRGEVVEYRGYVNRFESTRRIATCRSQESAENFIKYWKEVAEFRDSTD